MILMLVSRAVVRKNEYEEINNTHLLKLRRETTSAEELKLDEIDIKELRDIKISARDIVKLSCDMS